MWDFDFRPILWGLFIAGVILGAGLTEILLYVFRHLHLWWR